MNPEGDDINIHRDLGSKKKVQLEESNNEAVCWESSRKSNPANSTPQVNSDGLISGGRSSDGLHPC